MRSGRADSETVEAANLVSLSWSQLFVQNRTFSLSIPELKPDSGKAYVSGSVKQLFDPFTFYNMQSSYEGIVVQFGVGEVFVLSKQVSENDLATCPFDSIRFRSR